MNTTAINSQITKKVQTDQCIRGGRTPSSSFQRRPRPLKPSQPNRAG
jgi:hypothetical protein